METHSKSKMHGKIVFVQAVMISRATLHMVILAQMKFNNYLHNCTSMTIISVCILWNFISSLRHEVAVT